MKVSRKSPIKTSLLHILKVHRSMICFNYMKEEFNMYAFYLKE